MKGAVLANNSTRSPSDSSGPKILVVGLDGATLDLIRPWAAEGALPTFARIISEGTWGRLGSVIPPLTGPAWLSFMTGKNPGKHGIFDFIRRGKSDYHGVPINASLRDGDTLWQLLSEAGKRVGVLSVPATYPPEPVNGFMVTGMLTPPDATDYTSPPSLAQELKRAVPSFTMTPEGTAHALGREARLIDALERLTEMNMDTVRYLMSRYEWDFFMTVFKETDVAMHWLWRFMDQRHPWYVRDAPDRLRQGLRQCYQRVDACLAELLNTVGDDTILIIMSDHGSGPLEQYIHVNAWLLSQGFMQLKRSLSTGAKRLLYQIGLTPISFYRLSMALGRGPQVAQTLRHHKTGAISLLRRVFLSFSDVDWSRTRVYSLGNYGQLYINLRGREPQGIVAPGAEYEQVVDELVDRLNHLRHPRTSQAIPLRVYRREEIYQGDHLEEGPDVVFLPEDMRYNGFGLYQFSSRSWLEPTFDRSGGHRMDGIVMLIGPGIRQGHELGEAALIDLAPTVLAALGVPIPNDMDGRVLSGAFEDGYFHERPIRHTAARAARPHHELELTPEQEEMVKERLRGLGYIA
ncbi:MAG: alkaline phosphatase family protein [Anaerolineae bacterium]